MSITLNRAGCRRSQKRFSTSKKYEEGTFLRVGVTGGGCSGFSYALGFDKEYDQQADSKTEQNGVAVVVDKKKRSVS